MMTKRSLLMQGAIGAAASVSPWSMIPAQSETFAIIHTDYAASRGLQHVEEYSKAVWIKTA